MSFGRLTAWALMWEVAGAAVGFPLIVLAENVLGSPGDLANACLGGLTVLAGAVAGTMVFVRWDWPGWLR